MCSVTNSFQIVSTEYIQSGVSLLQNNVKRSINKSIFVCNSSLSLSQHLTQNVNLIKRLVSMTKFISLFPVNSKKNVNLLAICVATRSTQTRNRYLRTRYIELNAWLFTKESSYSSSNSQTAQLWCHVRTHTHRRAIKYEICSRWEMLPFSTRSISPHPRENASPFSFVQRTG